MKITRITYYRQEPYKVERVIFDSKKLPRSIFERVARVNEYLEKKVNRLEKRLINLLG